MQPMVGAVSALAVIAIYYLWRGYFQLLLGRQQTLRRRVAHLLWATAYPDACDSDDCDEVLEYELIPDARAFGP